MEGNEVLCTSIRFEERGHRNSGKILRAIFAVVYGHIFVWFALSERSFALVDVDLFGFGAVKERGRLAPSFRLRVPVQFGEGRVDVDDISILRIRVVSDDYHRNRR